MDSTPVLLQQSKQFLQSMENNVDDNVDNPNTNNIQNQATVEISASAEISVETKEEKPRGSNYTSPRNRYKLSDREYNHKQKRKSIAKKSRSINRLKAKI